MRNHQFAISVALLLGAAGSTFGQASLSNGSPSYSQNFDTLANTGTPTWTQNSTLLGWWATRSAGGPSYTAYTPGTGSITTGTIYSFGSASASDRALGDLGSSGTGTNRFALVIQNTGTTDIVSLLVQYVGEQWRDGGNSPVAAQTMTFEYSLRSIAPVVADIEPGTPTYVAVTSLDFTSPTFTNTGSGAALDGNLAANRTARSGTLSVTIPANSYIILRWTDINHGGNDHGLSIDDFSVTATFADVPTPGAASLLGLGGLLITRRRRA